MLLILLLLFEVIHYVIHLLLLCEYFSRHNYYFLSKLLSLRSQRFEKVIVITHLDELKDAFPVRIEVQKDENGSTFWLS